MNFQLPVFAKQAATRAYKSATDVQKKTVCATELSFGIPPLVVGKVFHCTLLFHLDNKQSLLAELTTIYMGGLLYHPYNIVARARA